jgi:hypothetical protein
MRQITSDTQRRTNSGYRAIACREAGTELRIKTARKVLLVL